jgi:hypothetical protein
MSGLWVLTCRMIQDLTQMITLVKMKKVAGQSIRQDRLMSNIQRDINELAVYSKMYYDIETVKSDPLIADEYPHGNPFDHIIDIMKKGAIIIGFKYILTG